MDVPTFIENHEKVVSFFGHWPSFHDANVIFYRSVSPDSAVIMITLHTWNMTSEVDAKGFFVLKDHGLVTLRFEETSDHDMDEFSEKNILSSMHIVSDAASPTFIVELNSVMDMSGSFRAKRGAVTSVVPCMSNGKPA